MEFIDLLAHLDELTYAKFSMLGGGVTIDREGQQLRVGYVQI